MILAFGLGVGIGLGLIVAFVIMQRESRLTTCPECGGLMLCTDCHDREWRAMTSEARMPGVR